MINKNNYHKEFNSLLAIQMKLNNNQKKKINTKIFDIRINLPMICSEIVTILTIKSSTFFLVRRRVFSAAGDSSSIVRLRLYKARSFRCEFGGMMNYVKLFHTRYCPIPSSKD